MWVNVGMEVEELAKETDVVNQKSCAAKSILESSPLVHNAGYFECLFDKACGNKVIADAEGYFVTPLIAVDNTKDLSWSTSAGSYRVIEYNGDTPVDSWTGFTRTITLNSETTHIRATGKIGTSLEIKNGDNVLWEAGVEGVAEDKPIPTSMLEDKDVFGQLGGITIKTDLPYSKGDSLGGFQKIQEAVIIDGTIVRKNSEYNKRIGYYPIEKGKIYALGKTGTAVYNDAYIGIVKKVPAVGDALLCCIDGNLKEEICIVSPCDGYICFSYDSNIDADIQPYSATLTGSLTDKVLAGVVEGANTIKDKALHYNHMQVEDAIGYSITDYIPIPDGADVSWSFSNVMPKEYGAFFYDGNKVYKDKYHLQVERTVSAADISAGGFKYVVITIPTNDANAEIRIGGNLVYPRLLSARLKEKSVGVAQLDDEVRSAIVIGTDVETLNYGITDVLRNLNHPSGRFVLAHISDIHADGTRLKRFVDWCKSKGSLLDTYIHTGDAVHSTYDDGYDFWDTAGAESVLNVVGNHDVAGDGTPSYDWKKYINVPSYNRYIKPYVSQWGVSQPSGAEANGLCYYSKDFTSKGVRLIVLDDNTYDSAQNTWFTAQLASAKSANLSVIVAVHAVPATPKTFECPFTSYIPDWGASTWMGNALNAVDDFVTNGGDFICWFGGHDHSDQVGVISSHPKQLFILVNTGARVRGTQDGIRTQGTKSEDAFNLLAVDRDKKLISVVRVGYSIDKWGRNKNSMLLNYAKAELILCQ